MRAFLVFLLSLLSMASNFPRNGSVCPTDSLYNVSSCLTYFNHRMNWSWAQNSQRKIIDQLRNGQDGQEVIIKQKVCVELIATQGFLKWNNTDCQERRPFLCQALSFHSELSAKQSKLTKVSKVTESDEKNKDYKLTKYDGETREKRTIKKDKNTKENFFTNSHSSEKSLSPFLMVSLVFISFLISLFPKIKSPKQDLQS